MALVQYIRAHSHVLQDVKDSLKYEEFGINFDLMNPHLFNPDKYKQDSKHNYQSWNAIETYQWQLSQPQQK